jgi:hypothetical protein
MNKTKVKINYTYSKKKQKDLIEQISKDCDGAEVFYEDGDFYVMVPDGQQWNIVVDAHAQLVECYDRQITDKLRDLFR